MNIQKQFKIEFDKAFQWQILATDRAMDLQVDLEATSDFLAGPLFSILKDGNCNYVFKKGEKRFPGVTTVNEFRLWAVRVAEEFKNGVESFEASNLAEEADREKLLLRAIAMRRAAELAYQIQQKQSE